MTAVLSLAVVGFVSNLLGRWLIVRADESLTRSRRWLVMLVPGAELCYIMTRFDRGRAGCFVCALSFAFALPAIGKVSQAAQIAKTSPGKGLFSGSVRESLTRDANHVHGQEEEQKRLLQAKGAKLSELEAYLKEWYGLLQERRASLCDERPEETMTFNADAAAYHGLLTASKTELSELASLQSTTAPRR